MAYAPTSLRNAGAIAPSARRPPARDWRRADERPVRGSVGWAAPAQEVDTGRVRGRRARGSGRPDRGATASCLRWGRGPRATSCLRWGWADRTAGVGCRRASGGAGGRAPRRALRRRPVFPDKQGPTTKLLDGRTSLLQADNPRATPAAPYDLDLYIHTVIPASFTTNASPPAAPSSRPAMGAARGLRRRDCQQPRWLAEDGAGKKERGGGSTPSNFWTRCPTLLSQVQRPQPAPPSEDEPTVMLPRITAPNPRNPLWTDPLQEEGHHVAPTCTREKLAGAVPK
jgi:hypothetical protein